MDITELKSFTFEPIPTNPPKTNIFEIAGFPRRETVSSNVFAFFFDPEATHGLDDLFFQSLIKVLRKKSAGTALFERAAPENEEVTVQTEVSDGSDTQNRIDILLQTPSLVIGIENKVDATLYNDLDDYLRKAKSASFENGECETCIVVLHASDTIDVGSYKTLTLRKNFFCVTYDEFFNEVLKQIGKKLFDIEKRSLDLLEQFIDNYSQRRNNMKNNSANELISQFTNQANSLQDAIVAVEKSKALYVQGCLKKIISLQTSFIEKIKDENILGIKVTADGIWDAGHHIASKNNETHINEESVYAVQTFDLTRPSDSKNPLIIEFFSPIDHVFSTKSIPLDSFSKIYIKAHWGGKQWKPENQIRDYWEVPLKNASLTDDNDKIISALIEEYSEIIQSVSTIN
ncbi:MAG: PD-(D/E)XK nuclease family protein [Bifidobacteriaceae bacterium]|jgi:hypothetical protein|nr:PD-(D/E)XK nuclease family protein [Bifidobacteriaceae bacterium]